MSLKIPGGSGKDFSRPLSGDLRAEFEAFLIENGMTPDPKKDLVVGGDVGRAFMDVAGKQKLVGWYQVWLDQEVPFGRCGDRTISNDEPIAKWKPENAANYKPTPEQEEERRLNRERAAQKKEDEQAQAALFRPLSQYPVRG